MRDVETGWVEADITINGHRLSFAESMALRVAVSSFRMFVCHPENADGLGVRLAMNYDVHLQSVEEKMLKTS